MKKKLRNLAIILGLSGAAFSSDMIHVEHPQDNQVEEGFLAECFSYHKPLIEEPGNKETIDHLINNLYEEMTDTGYERKNIRNAIKRINKYDRYFEKCSKRYGVEKNLAKAVAYVESKGRHKGIVVVRDRHDGLIIRRDPEAITTSESGALGMMQLTPETAEWLRVNPENVYQNIRGGIKLMGLNLNLYNQNIPLALNAYNAGRSAMRYLTMRINSKDFMEYRQATSLKAIREYPIKVLAAKKLFEEEENNEKTKMEICKSDN